LVGFIFYSFYVYNRGVCTGKFSPLLCGEGKGNITRGTKKIARKRKIRKKENEVKMEKY
jgi:hypothetical protein